MSGTSGNKVTVLNGLISDSAKVNQTTIGNADYTVLVANSGSTHVVGTPTANRVITLPAVATATNCRFRFVFSNKAAFSWTIRAPAGTLHGTVTNNIAASATAVTAYQNADLVRSGTANNISIGDWAEFYCDGTNYYVSGACGCGNAGAGAAGYSVA